ncbi:SusD/RagB family nutrient-binding outer membrane lipoprotein [Parabacteroides pacaensis]|uniref:SusD/RagB family nutrient-binding outer membrane lipoprotein n=1 Tax=Parabacteroides pacaensis TaxID=2086575 RepID=UPI000D0FB858|nr:SusD/RagB family nutrient-binding outer membrane lipoprotein [Parabacteroides pacaensis]
MKKKIDYFFPFILSSIIFFSCTRNFQDLNTDKSGITEDDMKIDYNNLGIPLNIIQQGIYFNYDFGKGKNWPYQIMQNLSADMFSGYMHDYKPHNGGSSNSDYNLQDGWNGTFWGYTYSYVFPQIKKSEDSTRLSYPAFFGVTKILKVETMHRVSDYYGPIIYTHFGERNKDYLPDTQQEAYYAFFNDLDTAVYVLSNYLEEFPEGKEPSLDKFDILLDGKCATWIKFANSLRLRLAIRLAMVDPLKAKQEFLKGFANPYGMLEEENETVAVSTRNGYTNPLGEINKVWEEVFMNASMESILNGYEDPRRERFFEPCEKDIILEGTSEKGRRTIPLKGKYKGIRQGTCFSHTLYSSHSKISISQLTPAILMSAAEIWFLRAEAALRKWTEEDVGSCYRKGIEVSFNQWGVSDPTYLESDKTGADYIDALDESNNIKARCNVSPRWIEEADKETKLEKIITQKWLAVFPEGCEAWAEQRRTGYPRLFPVKVNHSKDGCIDTEIMIRRLNFPGDLTDMEYELYEALKKAFNKPDHAGSRLWWDTGKNF